MPVTAKDYRLDWILREGDTIQTADAVYTITGEPIGLGGSSILYPASKSGSHLDYAIKECFPANPAAYQRTNGIVRTMDPTDELNQNKLTEFREIISKEKELGQKIRNTTMRAVSVWDELLPVSITTGGETFHEVFDGGFSVLERVDKKGRFFNELLGDIRNTCPPEDRRTTFGLPSIQLTVQIMEQALSALKQVHDAGYYFGDLSGSNLLLTECDLEKGHVGIGHLIDFGSTRKLEADGYTAPIINEPIFSTDGFKPFEIRDHEGDVLRLGKQADIYSAGCLFLRCVLTPAKIKTKTFGGSPTAGSEAVSDVNGKAIGCSDNALQLVNEILDKATQYYPKDRYADASEMLDAILELKKYTEPPRFLLPSNLSSPDYWVPHSRDKELAALSKAVNEGETVFLHGVGGVGKTECAIQLATRLNPPRGSYLVHFQNSMKETILRMHFSGYKFDPKQKGLSLEDLREAEYRERLDILREHYRDTLLIVDNFDADNKTLDELRREPAFKDFLGLKLKRIFTTRYPVGRKEWEIRELSESSLLTLMRYYCTDNNITDGQYLAILKEIQNHTLTATLIAKTLEESWGDITPEMILDALRNSKLSENDYPEVVSDQNRSYQERQIHEHLKVLFAVNHLDKDAQRIVSYASLFPNNGILVSFLTQLLHKNDKEKIKRLVKLGWIISFDPDVSWVDEWWYRELNIPLDKKMVRMHPLIREVICNEVPEYEQYCLFFLGKLKDYYHTVRDSEYRWAEEFNDDGEVNNPNYPYISECLILASNMLPKHKSRLLHDAGEILWDLHDSRAIACFQKAVVLEEKNMTSKHFMAECYTSLGDAYSNYFLGHEDRNKALEYTVKAIELMESGAETGEFDTSELAKAYHKLAYKYHFTGDDESFAYWMEKCVHTSLQCWDPNHPRIASGYKCLAEAYRYLMVHYKERILRKKHLEHKLENGGFQFEHQETEYQSMLTEAEYAERITYAENRLAECSLFITRTYESNL